MTMKKMIIREEGTDRLLSGMFTGMIGMFVCSVAEAVHVKSPLAAFLMVVLSFAVLGATIGASKTYTTKVVWAKEVKTHKMKW